MDDNQKVFKLASIMLQYPKKEWLKFHLIKQEIANLDDQEIQQHLIRFVHYLEEKPLEEVCQTYVSTFDFNEKTTLYLTYPTFGDNRERGPAFLELKQQFEEAGYYLEKEELPDFFPLILEFASVASTEQNEKLFKIHRKAIEQLLIALEKLDSPYVPLLQACTLAINEYMKQSKAS